MPAACEVDREHRVPADEDDRERRAAGAPGDGSRRGEHAERGEPLEEPRRGVGRGAGGNGHRLREQGEDRAVDRRRFAPVRADVGRRRALREGRRRVDVGVAAPLARDPAVPPVRPRVGREEQRRGERDELDRDRDEKHEPKRRAASGERDPGDVRGERQREHDEKRPRGSLVACEPSVGTTGEPSRQARSTARTTRQASPRRRAQRRERRSPRSVYRSSLEPGASASGRAGVSSAFSSSSSGSGVVRRGAV